MFRFIAEELAAGKRLVVATVVARTGSGPRKPGAMLVLSAHGAARGTVGGGGLEARVLEAAKSALADGRARLFVFDLNAAELSDAGMVCGGRVDILIDRLDGKNPGHLRLFQKLAGALDAGYSACLLTSMSGKSDDLTTGRGLLIGDDFDHAGLVGSFGDAVRWKPSASAGKAVLLKEGDARCFFQPVCPPGRVHIIGAGHVGQALAVLCQVAGFQTVVIDIRPEYACTGRFPKDVAIRLVEDYAGALQGVALHASDSVVIATHSHLSDRDVLAAALSTRAGYIGMLASRRKRGIIYDSLLKQGFTPEDLARVHSPAGLAIGAETPAEIAVSIVAELIAVRNAKPETDETCRISL